MRWTIRRLVLVVALPLAAGGAVTPWLGIGPGLTAATLGALLSGWIVIGYTVREATPRRRTAERVATSGLQWVQALAQVSTSLSQPIDRNRLLRQIADALASLTSAHNVVLWEVDAASGRLVCRAWIARHREPLFIDDIARDGRVLAAD